MLSYFKTRFLPTYYLDNLNSDIVEIIYLETLLSRWLTHHGYYSMLDESVVFLTHTLYNVILRIARNLLKTSENIKISTHPFYHTYSKWPIFQNRRFSKSPILEIFSRKFHRLVLGLVGLIDAKDIDVAQPIWW